MKILAGTNNPGKIIYWRTILPEYEVVSLKELGIDLDVKEGLLTVEENAKKKSVTYAKESGMLTVSDDRGLRIPALNDEPGVAVRTWGHTIPRLDDDEWMEFFKDKMKDVKDMTGIFDTAICISRPDGETETIIRRDKGHFDLSLTANTAVKGFPLSNIFVRDDYHKSWVRMTEKEKQDYQKDVSEKVVGAIKKLS